MESTQPKAFPELDKQWFRRHGFDAVDAEQAAQSWKAWTPRSSGRARVLYREALRRTVRKSAAAVEHYLSDDNWQKLGNQTLKAMDAISIELGFEPPKRSTPRPGFRGTHRIALLTELANIPSPRYHLEVIRRIVEAASPYRLALSIHELSQTDSRMKTTVSRIVRDSRPHGVIWFRLTPDPQSLDFLLAQSVAAVVVAGARLEYMKPVLGHLIPGQASIKSAVKLWAAGISGKTAGREAVVAAMPREDLPRSIRNERIDLIAAGLREAGLEPKEFLVADYSASNAFAILEAHPHAAAYVCLSDEIAIGIKHLLLVKGQKAAGRMILGFDDSPLAAKHGISSISQHLEEIGNRVRDLFTRFYEQRSVNPKWWPEFREVPIEVNLTPRE